jgi:hypothetical protein
MIIGAFTNLTSIGAFRMYSVASSSTRNTLSTITSCALLSASPMTTTQQSSTLYGLIEQWFFQRKVMELFDNQPVNFAD